jgi:hypothetical protein
MTQSVNQDSFIQSAQLEVYDPVTGHIDAAASAEAARQVLADSNTVRVNGVVDHVQTLAKRKTAKQSFLATRNN